VRAIERRQPDAQDVMSQGPPVRTGIGLRAQHQGPVLRDLPDIGWLEVHSENYFAPGGPHLDILDRLADRYPLSLHGVGLSLGSTDGLDRMHLQHLKSLIGRYRPHLVSEHLSWSHVQGRHANDLLPLPYTAEALQLVSRHISQAQDALGCRILIENVSSYLEFSCSAMTEWEFLAGVAARSGCAILLDVNNIYVAAVNHGFDARTYLRSMPAGSVLEIHLAGHARVQVQERQMLIDTHDAEVCEEVWSLYREAATLFPAAPTLIEWDARLPPLGTLVQEAHKADAIREKVRAIAA
jgi:uncharacterized protein